MCAQEYIFLCGVIRSVTGKLTFHHRALRYLSFTLSRHTAYDCCSADAVYSVYTDTCRRECVVLAPQVVECKKGTFFLFIFSPLCPFLLLSSTPPPPFPTTGCFLLFRKVINGKRLNSRARARFHHFSLSPALPLSFS